MKIIFSSCDYADDFEALVDISEFVEDIPQYKFALWLKAYDTSCRETNREISLFDDEYRFDCYMYILNGEDNSPVVNWIEPRAAKTRQDAENFLIKMANDVSNNKKVIDTLTSLL